VTSASGAEPTPNNPPSTPIIHTDRPARAFGHVGVAAQLIQDPGQGAVA